MRESGTRETGDKQLEALIMQVLERRPAVNVPEDFAARVAARVPAVNAGRAARLRPSVARTAATLATVLLVVALFALAPHVRMNGLSLSFGIEMLLLAELAGIGYGLMRMRENGL
jgi:hypothetical protein